MQYSGDKEWRNEYSWKESEEKYTDFCEFDFRPGNDFRDQNHVNEKEWVFETSYDSAEMAKRSDLKSLKSMNDQRK